LPEATLSGTFETIDETGALVLGTDNGPVTLPAAEVFF
jgi:biotin-(acetyl-CoA carboxylase) ligase